MARRRTRRLLTLAQLKELIAARSEQILDLLKEKHQLAKGIRSVDRQIKVLRGRGAGRLGLRGAARVTLRRRRRPRNAQTMTQVLVGALKQKNVPMSPLELTEAVRAAGYKSSAKNLRAVVYQALRNSPQIVHHNVRGMYRLKSDAKK